jgi:hypothetical protein
MRRRSNIQEKIKPKAIVEPCEADQGPSEERRAAIRDLNGLPGRLEGRRNGKLLSRLLVFSSRVRLEMELIVAQRY